MDITRDLGTLNDDQRAAVRKILMKVPVIALPLSRTDVKDWDQLLLALSGLGQYLSSTIAANQELEEARRRDQADLAAVARLAKRMGLVK